MIQDPVARGLLEGEDSAVALIRGWIRTSLVPYRSRLAEGREDLEQDVLVELTTLLRQEKFRGDCSFETFVRTCTHHRAIDRLRVNERRSWTGLEDLELATPAPSALEEMSRAERLRMATEIGRALSPTCREVLQLLAAGLRYREISARLGVSEGTLRARVLRCRAHAIELRDQLFGESTKKVEKSLPDL
jgi:RNA polymerase sigma factor (sigma-70 family)